MTRPISRRSRRSAQRVRVVVDVMMDVTVVEAVDVVEDAKVTTKSGETIRGIVIEIIMDMVFKIVAMLGCSIVVVRSVDGMTPILLYFMPFSSMILALFPCLLAIIICNYQGILLVSHLELEPMRELYWE